MHFFPRRTRFTCLIFGLVLLFFVIQNYREPTLPATDSDYVECSEDQSSKRDSNSTNSTLTRRNATKTFLYLIQAPSCLPVHLQGEQEIGSETTCSCDVLILSYKGKCCSQQPPKHIEYLHLNGTTWNTGRNYLHKHAMKRTTKYLYYIFMDDDIRFRFTANSKNTTRVGGPWRSFERFLFEYKPAVAVPSYCSSAMKTCDSKKVPSVYVMKGLDDLNAAINAFHYEALPYLLPYIRTNEDVTWWVSQKYLNVLAAYYFQDYILVHSQVASQNALHRKYPRKEITVNMDMMEDLFVIIRKRNKLPPKWNGVKVEEVGKMLCKC